MFFYNLLTKKYYNQYINKLMLKKIFKKIQFNLFLTGFYSYYLVFAV